ncbi:efflux RND transporter permease subunit [Solimonas marina]|uniref:Efflux RND transporter permease subunit n=1 Tax=Solimonas marina TaxID=2714601 RepID=A0A969W7R5_9GAMM|nr:efflux RND transporter permease subunit [Solimonas marina]NKF21049.1 efflux RND transporter permease subunit [Solimonas marina]
MNVNFSAWSIHRPTPAILLFVLATVAGFFGFRALQIANMPDFDFPGVIVDVQLPGATPTQLETEVTRKIEDATANIPGARHVTSTVSDGFSETFIEFEIGKNVQEALDDVRDAVTGVRSALPADILEPTIHRVTTNGGSIATYAISADNMDETDLSWFVDNIVSKAIMPISGVGKVSRFGGVTREVRIELQPDRLQAFGVTAGEISRQINSMQQQAPGGRGDVGGLEQAVRTTGLVQDAQDLANLSIPLSDGRRIRLGQVAKVLDTNAEPRQAATLDGKPVISLRAYRANGAAEAEVATAIVAEVDKLAKQYPHVHFEKIYTTVGPIEHQYHASMQALLEGAILAVVVVWIFLRDWRATLISAIALPLSVIPTFAFIHWAGYTLNTITLLALTLVIGILVDDAIVEVENIMRHLRMGKTPKQAALEAADEIGLAVIATSLTLVSVFLPVALMPGISGLVFKQFGWTASIAILASLVVARLLTPMMAAYLLNPNLKQEEHGDGPVMRFYMKTVRTCLRHPWLTCIGAAVFFVVSIMMVTALPSTFLNSSDDALTLVTIEAPPGSTLDETLAINAAAYKRLKDIPEIVHVYTIIGNGIESGSTISSGGSVTTATLLIPLTPQKDRKRTQQQIEKEIDKRLSTLPGARVTVGGNGNGRQLTVQLTSEDPQILQATADNVLREIRTLRGLGGATSSANLLRPEIVIRPDFARAAELGVTAEAIGDAVRIATSGDYDVILPKLNLPERQLYIRTMLDPASRTDLDTIRQLRVASIRGPVPLGNVANVSIQGGPAQIDRYDRARNVTLTVNLQGKPLGEVNKEIEALPAMKHLPPQVRRGEGGDVEFMNDLFGNFAVAMLTGIFCVYAVMVLLFHDFFQPFTVLAALPLAAGGALGALLLFGMSLSLASLIGLLMLIGIVSKNSILLVEYAIAARDHRGLSRLDAILDACHKRARPIVMTTVAMVAGMLPMALDLSGADSGFRAPMATTVIGGLITSTVLSLVVVPVVYEIVDNTENALGRLFRRRRKAAPDVALPSGS